MSESGHISIHSENILPIIKRWLYSEKEIFLRELVSNAADALTKLHKLSLVGEAADVPEPKIEIAIDADAKTLTITDTGLGMTGDEVKKYINQVAFSGVQDFLEKYKDKEDSQQVIGHFGLGFYSAFMVADRIEIDTLSYRDGAEAVHWSCDGSTQFTLTSSERKSVGTSIILHIGSGEATADQEADGHQEMLDINHIRMLLGKYCAFVRYPIYLEDQVVNEPQPLWAKSPTELKDEDYKGFFHKLFGGLSEPLFWIHLNVDYPFNLKGILYFPQLSREVDPSKGEVKLFCNQVYVADNVKELIPEFLTMLKGVIDCPDLPLNVSRSYLQNDPTVRKIAEHITKKVADKLSGLAKTDRENYEKYWRDIHPFVKFGMMREPKFRDRMKDHLIFPLATVEGNESEKSSVIVEPEVAPTETKKRTYVTLEEYATQAKGQLTENTVVYATDEAAQAGFLKMLSDQKAPVLLCEEVIDLHFLPFWEAQGSGVKFVRVDADDAAHFVDGDHQDLVDPRDQKRGSESVKALFETFFKDRGQAETKVKAEAFKSDRVPALFVESESMRRLKEMGRMSGFAAMQSQLAGEGPSLVLNLKNGAVKRVLEMSRGIADHSDRQMLMEHIVDLARLQQGMMTPEMMQQFIERSSQLMAQMGHASVNPLSGDSTMGGADTAVHPAP